MEKFNLPFEIGQDYETLEFDLEVLTITRMPNHDSYLYLGEIKKFLNSISDKTELIFYWDKLEFVIITFENKKANYFIEFSNALKVAFKEIETTMIENHILQKFKHKNIEYWCDYNQQSNTIIVLYGMSETIKQAYLSLLS